MVGSLLLLLKEPWVLLKECSLRPGMLHLMFLRSDICTHAHALERPFHPVCVFIVIIKWLFTALVIRG